MQIEREWLFISFSLLLIPIHQAYLNKYGYIDDNDMEDGMPKTDSIRQTAIEYFQLRSNITLTGKEDELVISSNLDTGDIVQRT